MQHDTLRKTAKEIFTPDFIRVVFGSIFGVLIAAMIGLIVVRNFSVEEAEQALGETYDYSEGWTVTYADGTVKENVTLPLTIPAKDASSVTIANTLQEDYAGLAMDMHVDNAAVRAYLDGRQIFESGYSNEKMGGTWQSGGTVVPEEKQAENNELTDAENAVAEAERNVEEKRAAVDSANKDVDEAKEKVASAQNHKDTLPSDATEEDKTKAENDLIQANNDLESAQSNYKTASEALEQAESELNVKKEALEVEKQRADLERGSTDDPQPNPSNGSASTPNNTDNTTDNNAPSRQNQDNSSRDNRVDSGNDSFRDNGMNSDNGLSRGGGMGSGDNSGPTREARNDDRNRSENKNDTPDKNNANANPDRANQNGGADRQGNAENGGDRGNQGNPDGNNPNGPTGQQESGQNRENSSPDNRSYIGADVTTKNIEKESPDTDDASKAETGDTKKSSSDATNSSASASGTASNLTKEEKKQEAISTQMEKVKGKVEYKEKTQANYLKTEAGDFLIDLNANVNEDSVLILVFEQAKPDKPVMISAPWVAQRDVAVISVLRESVLPLACCIVIIILSAILVTLDFTRVISHRRTRGLARLALLAIDMMLYSFIDTDIPVLFFNNEWFFMIMGEMCYVLVPLLLAWFFDRGFRRHYPKRTAIMLWISALYALAALAMEVTRFTYFADLSYITLGVQLFAIGMILWMLYDWKRDSQRYKLIWLDVVGYLFLTIALLTNPLWDFYPEAYVLEIVTLLTTTACFLFLTAQHIHIVLFEYREHANAAAKRLAEEMERVEEKNAQLKVARIEAEEAKQEAIMANEAKGNFLANMSHEIRTPINAVLGMDEMILRETKEKDTRGYAMDIFTAGHTLLSLINDILDFSKIESGKMEIVPVDYDMSSMINDLYNMVSARAKAKDLAVSVEVDEHIPSRFYGDDVRIRQILTNILTNAVKYTPEGQVWLRISGRREADYEILHFEVEDTGIGIKEEDLPKLFEAYQRIEEGRNRNIEGTGLGMNITLQLLGLMDSHLEVDSVYGKGSKFWFDLRQRITNDTPIGNFKERIQQQSDNYQYTESFIAPDARVLVVDDNSMNRKVFLSLLKATRIQIDEAESGQAAIGLAGAQHYDMIFMDHMMPEMDGVEAMRRIKAMTDGPCADTPIFVLTANAVAGAKEEYLQMGFDGFISKPVVSDRLEEAIRDTLPGELVLPAEESADAGDAGTDAADNSFLEELPAVDGLDWYFAFMHLPDREILEQTVKEFATLLPVHAKKLAEMYAGLSAHEAYENYRIQVHGMKSSAATVGIVPLAGMAKVLEFAARDEDEDVIRQMHPIFLREWESYTDKLRGVFGIGEEDDADKPDADMDKVNAMLEMLVAAMEDFDVDAADELVEQLLSYHYEDGVADKITELKAAVADLDEELVGQLVREIQSGAGMDGSIEEIPIQAVDKIA